MVNLAALGSSVTGAKRREWMGMMGVAGMLITSDDWDHSRTFPTKHQEGCLLLVSFFLIFRGLCFLIVVCVCLGYFF